MNCYGLNVERLICEYGITDLHDLWLIVDASRLWYGDWPMISDLKSKVRQNGTVAVIDRIERRLYHHEEYKAGLL